MYGLVMFALFSMYDPIRKLSRIHVQIQRAFASSTRIVELLDTHREIQDKPGARIHGRIPGLRGISKCLFRLFRPERRDARSEGHQPRRRNRNQVIAIVGSSGSGKTTLVGLIPRFYDPTSGVVRIDGIDIREFTQNSLRSQIAIVTQETFLFNDTVRNNIAYGNINASEEKIIEASRAALADDFICKVPDEVRHDDRRKRPEAFRRRTPADIDRPGAAERCPDPDSR